MSYILKQTLHYTTFILFLVASSLSAQFNCGTDVIHQQKQQSVKSLAGLPFAKTNSSASYTIPVVVHVIQTGTVIGTPQNPSDAQIMASIDVLNQAYKAIYPGYPDTTNSGVNIGVCFQLAQRDPNCNPTNGIERIDKSGDSAFISSVITPSDGLVLYNLSHWNPLEYCNLYVTNNVSGANGFSSIGGYVAPGTFDGVVISAPFLPSFSNYYAPTYINKNPPWVISHELGHYLGLLHTFNWAYDPTCPTNNNCLTQGDCVCDTDPHLQSCQTSTCGPATINPCTGQPLGNLFHNYMSYFQDTIGLFTPGQKARILNTITQSRPDLVNSQALYAPQLSTPTASVHATFPNASVQAYCGNSPLDFFVSGANHGGSPQYFWYINGVLTTTTTSQGPVSYTVNPTDTVTCKVVSSSLCVTTPTVISNKYVFPLITGTLSATLSRLTNDSLCVGDSIFFVMQSPAPGDFKYYWYNTFRPGTSDYSYSSFPNSSLYKQRADSSLLPSPFTSRWLYIDAYAVPLTLCGTPSFIQIKDSVFISKPPSKPLLSAVSNYLQCTSALHYQWYLAGTGLIGGATSQTYTPVQNGLYYCMVYNNGCSSRISDTLNFMTTGVTYQDLNRSISIYPNPASQELVIKSTDAELKKIELLNVSGQLIQQCDVSGKQYKLILTDLPAGVYFVKICDQSLFVSYKKLIIERPSH